MVKFLVIFPSENTGRLIQKGLSTALRTCGFLTVERNVEEIATEELQNCLDEKILEWYLIKTNIKKSLEKFIYDKTKRRPTIIPIIMEI